MTLALKINRVIFIVASITLIILLIFEYIFGLHLIYGGIYLIVVFFTLGSGLAYIGLKLIVNKNWGMLIAMIAAISIIISITTIALSPLLSFSDRANTIDIYFGTVEETKKVYFETNGFFFMSDLPYYELEEADVKFGIFYKNRKTIAGGHV